MNLNEFLDKFEELVKADKYVKIDLEFSTIRLEASGIRCCPVCYVSARMGNKNYCLAAGLSRRDIGLTPRATRIIMNAADCTLEFSDPPPETVLAQGARKRMLDAIKNVAR